MSEPNDQHDEHAADAATTPVRVISRTLVTSQPDIACDVCERRLLRGEHPEIFLAAGQPRTVCELCAPRATHQGWTRESDDAVGDLGPSRARRARGLFERLRAGSRTLDGQGVGEGDEAEGVFDGLAPTIAARAPYGDRSASRDRARAGAEREQETPAGGDDSLAGERAADHGPLARALDMFNAGDYPRRIGGVARSLGPPEVNVRELDVVGVVAIVVAWELCWYRYRVDLDDPATGAALIAQGTELSELELGERYANAVADDGGALHLSASA